MDWASVWGVGVAVLGAVSAVAQPVPASVGRGQTSAGAVIPVRSIGSVGAFSTGTDADSAHRSVGAAPRCSGETPRLPSPPDGVRNEDSSSAPDGAPEGGSGVGRRTATPPVRPAGRA